MRRLFWVGVGVAAGAAGPRWVARRVAPRRATPGAPGTPERAPLAELAASAGTAAGRGAARLAAGGARRLGHRIQQAVAAGQADARAREAELRRALTTRAVNGGGAWEHAR